MRILGTVIVVISITIIIGWLGITDIDCYYTSGVLLEYRMCTEAIDETSKNIGIIYPIISVLLLAIGTIIIKVSAKKNAGTE